MLPEKRVPPDIGKVRPKLFTDQLSIEKSDCSCLVVFEGK